MRSTVLWQCAVRMSAVPQLQRCVPGSEYDNACSDGDNNYTSHVHHTHCDCDCDCYDYYTHDNYDNRYNHYDHYDHY
jgi:hypothetical protein